MKGKTLLFPVEITYLFRDENPS